MRTLRNDCCGAAISRKNPQVVDNQFEESDNAETRRMVELARQQEARTAASMGYNPYEARLMGNTVSFFLSSLM